MNLLSTKQNTTYDVGNSCPGLGQAQTCGGVKQGNWIPPLLITERKCIPVDYLHMKYKYVLTNSARISGRVTWLYGNCHVDRASACFEKQEQNTKLYHINYKEQSVFNGC